MNVGRAIFDLARNVDARSLFVVGIGKNVGKTVTMRAVYEAAWASGLRVGVASVGRDGEAFDIADGLPKPRLFLRAGTVLATAREALPSTPASELLEISPMQTAAGVLLYARSVHDAHYELIGPPSASGVRKAVAVLDKRCDFVIVDGAIDRIAAVAETPGAIVVATGASSAATMSEAVDAVRALVKRLSVGPADPNLDAVYIDGALTAASAARLIADREQRQVVVGDPTQIALSGKAATNALTRLNVRCRRPLCVIACTIASIGRERGFEPRTFARAVADATGLPAFDVYAGERAA